MKMILVPVDGSDSSIRAVKEAVALAELYHGSITLLHVFNMRLASNAFSPETTMKMQTELIEHSNKVLEEVKRYCAGLYDRVTIVSMEGNQAETIIEYADKNDIDMVVMGSHGMGGFKQFILGSVTAKVVNTISQPILLIR